MLRKNLESFLITYMTIIKSVKMSYSKPVGSRPGILYGNPKVHKPVVDNMPKLRPILSTINTPGYNLAKFLMPI